MNAQTEKRSIEGPAGLIECAIDTPAGADGAHGVAVLCHPHPQHGGTMDNKVVQTLARAFVQLGYGAVRFNFRGVGASLGHWDHGRGEVDDALAVIAAFHGPGQAGQPLVLGGFSFGGYVASNAAARLPEGERAERLVLIAPAVVNFPMAPVSQDTVLIHGEADEVVPLTALLDWARPLHLPVTVFPGTGHFFHGQLSLLKQRIVAGWQR
jgi:alpha/beta superfamily hydrolase